MRSDGRLLGGGLLQRMCFFLLLPRTPPLALTARLLPRLPLFATWILCAHLAQLLRPVLCLRSVALLTPRPPAPHVAFNRRLSNSALATIENDNGPEIGQSSVAHKSALAEQILLVMSPKQPQIVPGSPGKLHYSSSIVDRTS